MRQDRSGPPAAVPVPLLLGAHSHQDEPGGLPRYLDDLFAALRRAGVRPRAVVAGPALAAPVGVAAGGRLDEPFPLRLVRFARTASASSAGVDVVDAHFAFYAFVPVVFGRLRRLPLVVHFQGPWADESLSDGEPDGWRIAAKRSVERAVYRRAHTAVVLSSAFGRILVERYGVAPWAVEVIPPGVDLDAFAPGDRAGARARLDVADAAPLVVAVRRLVPRMGLDVLLDAWADVQSSIPGARLLVVGDGPERERLEARAAQRGVAGSVTLLGRVDESTVLDCYRAADLTVVPSTDLEGYGLVVLESLACGTPVVGTDAGGLAEALTAVDHTLVVPAGDAGALAVRVRTALQGSAPPPSPEACRRHAERFSWSSIADRHRDVYARAAGFVARRPRVVYLDHCAALSGGELALLRLLPGLDVDAHVVLAEDGPLVALLEAAGIGVEVLPLTGGTAAVSRGDVRLGLSLVPAAGHAAVHGARLAARLRRLRPDLIHTNSLKADLYGGVAARLASVPVVWHVRDRITPEYLPAFAVGLMRRAAGRIPAAIIANSQSTLGTLGPAGAAGVVIPSPLGIVPSDRPPEQRTATLRVGIVGRLDPWKGQHVFLDAFAKAFPGGGAEAVVVGGALFGNDRYEEQLRRRASDLGVGDRVELRGFRDDISAELGRLDVLVHASTIPEPFGQVVVEGMAAGLAVIAADAGGPAEVLVDGVTGLLYPPGDVDALADRLRLVASSADLRRRLAEAGLARAADFTVERIAPLVMDVYRGVLRA